MTGKTVGYIRVSTEEQNPERQLEGFKLDKVFVDKVSGNFFSTSSIFCLSFGRI